ncbi:hypothetical protein D1614_20435 [Maribellus luteus]|uniref:Uncharacterized protein n=1 Tax=Maribellus luteus TaxID=2305463 RepID=A0A399SVX0_9BACT|nr:hypothetical protein [Maribellus luteus]RIJ46097.1 hypothetical protein D1614_20435 [Maribellus luteus]
MKAIKFRLFATIFTLAAVITATTFEANAQRRSSQEGNESRRSTQETRKNVERKSTYKEYDKVQRKSVDPKLRSTRSEGNRSSVTKSGNNQNRSQSNNSRNSSANYQKRESNRNVTNQGNNRSVQKSSQATPSRNSNSTYRTSREQDRNTVRSRENDNRNVRVGTSTSEGRRNTGRTVNENRDFYRVDKADRRYSPSENYRGSSNYWKGNYRSERMNYNHKDKRYYSNYNYSKRNHWDRKWENYRWNYNSWRDYYSGYNPRSYTYSRYYFHHPHYGHVLSRFDYRPVVFVHNHHQYYCYNGHFFRYRPGVGYILVDLPYGFTFQYLPKGHYERVHVNGYLYFRIGNLFFEASNYGFNLVHYPERYYAYDDGFERPGYYYDDIYW